MVALLFLSLLSVGVRSAFLPECASSCVGEAIDASLCSSADTPCICSNEDFLPTLHGCIEFNCDEEEQEDAISRADQYCQATEPHSGLRARDAEAEANPPPGYGAPPPPSYGGHKPAPKPAHPKPKPPHYGGKKHHHAKCKNKKHPYWSAHQKKCVKHCKPGYKLKSKQCVKKPSKHHHHKCTHSAHPYWSAHQKKCVKHCKPGFHLKNKQCVKKPHKPTHYTTPTHYPTHTPTTTPTPTRYSPTVTPTAYY